MDANAVRAAWERAARRAAEGGGRAARDEAPARRVDAPTFMGAPAVATAEDLEGAAAVALGIPYGGADPELAGGPAAIRHHSRALASQIRRGPAAALDPWAEAVKRSRLVDYGDVTVDEDDVETTFMRAHDKLADIFAVGAVPIVFGGDHGISIPVLQVLAGKLAGKLGIVVFDARRDLGFEPRYGAGSQWARAFELGVVEPANFVEIGIREDLESSGETCVADELGLRCFTMTEVDELGVTTVTEEALEAATSGTEAVYVSLDVSVVDAALGAAGCADPTGLGARELLLSLRILSMGPLAAFDVCGLAPRVDAQGRLGCLAAMAAAEVLAGLAVQRP